MNKKKINIIDLSVIILVIILIIISVIKYRNYNAIGEENTKIESFQYNLKINNIRNYTVEAYEVGDFVYDNETNVNIGKIIAKSYEPSQEYVKINGGEFIKVDVPDKYDMILTIETPGLINETGYFANKSVKLKVGNDKIIETLYAKSTGTIIEISESEIAQ